MGQYCKFFLFNDDHVVGLESEYNRNGNLLLLNCYLPEHFYQCL